VIDTAGLRDTRDEVERIGIARTWAEIEAADAVLLLHDLTRHDEPGHADEDRAIAERLPSMLAAAGRLLHVYNKADATTVRPADASAVVLSARTGTGLEQLRGRLLELAGWHAVPEGVFIARGRHVEALRQTREHLALAQQQIGSCEPALDLLAEELRLAQQALGAITGEFSADDLLGEIFSRFCIGK
jgi:tRNA modification GTPase